MKTTRSTGETKQHPEKLSGIQPCICPHCATDEYLVPDLVEIHRAPGHGNSRIWDVGYWCSNCNKYEGHLTRELPEGWVQEAKNGRTRS